MSDSESDFEPPSHVSAVETVETDERDETDEEDRPRVRRIIDALQFVEEARAVKNGGQLKERNGGNGSDQESAEHSSASINIRPSSSSRSGSVISNNTSISSTSGIRAGQKFNRKQASRRFLHYVLTGQLPDRGEDGWQVQIALDDYTTTRDDDYVVTQDIDSVLGFGFKLPYNQGFELVVIPNLTSSLTKAVHISWKVDRKDVEVHRIPNLEFAVIGSGANNKIRLFLPGILVMMERLDKVAGQVNVNGLPDADDDDINGEVDDESIFADPTRPASVRSFVGEEEEVLDLLLEMDGLLVDGENKLDFMAIASRIYDDCVRPALQTVVREWMGHYPSSFEAECARVRGNNGRFGQSRHGLRPEVLPQFAEAVLENLSNISWGKGAFFGHETRGIKSSNSMIIHEFDLGADMRSLREHLKRACPFLDVEDVFAEASRSPQTALWYVDMGMEVNVAKKAMLVRKSTHADLISFLLEVSIPDARYLMSSRKRYEIDEICQLKQAAGLRLKGKSMGPMEAKFLQVYCSEKIPTYHLDKEKRAKTVTLKEALTDLASGGGRIVEQMKTNRDIYLDQTTVDDGFSARAELRVPILKAYHVKRYLPQDLFIGKFYLLPLVDFWHMKVMRQEALLRALEYIQKGSSEDLQEHKTLKTLMALIYVSNGLCSRPEEGSIWKELQGAVLKSTFVRGREVLLDDYGLFFLSEMGFDRRDMPIIINAADTMRRKTMTRAFGFSAWNELVAFIEKKGKKRPMSSLDDDSDSEGEGRRQLVIRAATNKRARTQTVYAKQTDSTRFFRLVEIDVILPKIDQSLSSVQEEAIDSNGRAHQLFMQFVGDLTTKQPVGSSQGSHLTPRGLEYVNRRRHDEDYFQIRNLSTVFTHFALAKGENRWKDTLELHFPSRETPDERLPPLQAKSSSCQGWKTFRYREQYMKLRADDEGFSTRDFKKFRSQLIGHINKEWKWMFASYKNNAFSTKKMNMASVFPPNHEGAAPVLVLNPNAPDIDELRAINKTMLLDDQPKWLKENWDTAARAPKETNTMLSYFGKNSTNHPSSSRR
ncbi:hypothetical protein ACEPAI_5555 [Sanghuangporus weigelae]